ncbi:2-polyprenylphenol 6-hydroxylase [Marinibaculum pumilum]|uniref:2-polyprenylphenol 6-hydroxylase n=1 Tax=Marinibaculum pumilum TaxID=1766165 RepID=A0ABV7L894_9PROT
MSGQPFDPQPFGPSPFAGTVRAARFLPPGGGIAAASALHLGRLFVIMRTLARHDAMFVFDLAPLPRLLRHGLRLAARLLARPRERRKWRGTQPGERLAEAFTALGPCFIKLGQALSVRPDLIGDELARDLGRLRDKLPPFATAEARATVEAALDGSLEALFLEFGETPVAAASIAQVHRAQIADPASGPPRQVAVKILRPGLERAFARDIALLHWLAVLAERTRPVLRRLRPVAVVETFARTVRMETDFRFEAAAASEFGALDRSPVSFRVPEVVWSHCSDRVLTLGWVEGIPVDDLEAIDAAGHDRRRLAQEVIQGFLHQALEIGFFHGDLHQGNLFVAPDGTLTAVDFGIVGRLDWPTRRTLAEILVGFISRDYRRAARAHLEAGYVPAGQSLDEFAMALRSIGEPIRDRTAAGISMGRLLEQMFQITELFGMQTQPQLLLLQKTMVSAEGIARSLDPEMNMWATAQPVVEAWLRSHLGPEARMRETAARLAEALPRLPQTLQALEGLAEQAGAQGLRLHPDTLRRLVEGTPGPGPGWMMAAYAGWTAALALLLLVIFA